MDIDIATLLGSYWGRLELTSRGLSVLTMLGDHVYCECVTLCRTCSAGEHQILVPPYLNVGVQVQEASSKEM